MVIKEVRPDYTQEAKQRQIEGTVTLAVVVDTDGAVTEVKVNAYQVCLAPDRFN